MVCSDTPTNMAATASATPTGRGRKDRLSHLRRQSVMESPGVAATDKIQDVSLQENDDERERNSRRQLRVLDDQEKNLSSPSTPSGRRLVLGTALSGLSNEELSEHYKECVRLSTENKITKKNAFQLHLIDYMADTIKKSGDDMNFQVASCALDASAKIYGYRVDALEADTCKLASELGRTHKTTENESNNSMGPENNLDPTKKKRKVRKSAKVEQNLKNITLDKIDRRAEVDTFRSQLACGFDEQGVAGLFVFNLPIIDDRCQLALDPNSKPPLLDTRRDYENNNTINISTFKEILRKIRDEKPTVDQTFENFDFKQVDNDELSPENASQPANNPEEFVYNQEIQEAEEEYSNHGSDPFLDADMMDADDRGSDTIVAAVGNNEKSKNPVLRLESINDTIGFLTAKPSEYSYYDPKLMSAWAGPNHWRFLPHCRRPIAAEKGQPPTKRKQKKAPPLVDFDAKPAEIVHNEAKNFLSKATLNKWSREKNELPFDHHYNIEDLGKSMLNPTLYVRSIKKVAKTIDADVGEGYNYDNPADKSNYCGADGDNNNSDADDDFPPAASPIGGDFGGNQEMEFSFTQPQTDAQTQAVAFTGENLIQQPYKIDKPFLAYEKTAKKIDAKKIKKAMWTILSNCEDEDKEVMEEPIKFTDLYKQIPKYISEAAAKNLSVPIAFVTFLHLCNEKVLHLSGEDEMSDFKIEQG